MTAGRVSLNFREESPGHPLEVSLALPSPYGTVPLSSMVISGEALVSILITSHFSLQALRVACARLVPSLWASCSQHCPPSCAVSVFLGLSLPALSFLTCYVSTAFSVNTAYPADSPDTNAGVPLSSLEAYLLT